MKIKRFFALKSVLALALCLILTCCAKKPVDSPIGENPESETSSVSSSVSSKDNSESSKPVNNTGIEVIKVYQNETLATAITLSKETFKDTSGRTMPYRLYVPKDRQSGKKYPVLLYLHGAGSLGTDNEKHITSFIQCFNYANDLLKDCIIICPQTPNGWDFNGYLGTAKRIVDFALKEYGGDPDRVYLTGTSLGSFATWNIMDGYPNFFAAAVPVCGGGGNYASKTLIDTPIWMYHGTSDGTVPFSSSETTYNAIKNAGGKLVKLTRLPGVDHDAWNYAYKDREMFCWMFEQNRKTHKSMDINYIGVLDIVSQDGKSIISDGDLENALHRTTSSEDYINLVLTDSAFNRFMNDYNKNKNGIYTLKITDKKVYDFKLTADPTNNTIRIENTIDKHEFNIVFRLIKNVSVKQSI